MLACRLLQKRPDRGGIRRGKTIVVMEGMNAAATSPIIDGARVLLAQRRLKLRKKDLPLEAVNFSAGVLSARGRTAAKLIAGGEVLFYHAKDAGLNSFEVEAPLVQG